MKPDDIALATLQHNLERATIKEIAQLVARDWGQGMGSYARVYVEAMLTMETVLDKYMLEDGDDIVIRFLSNAVTWRGVTARAVKLELNNRLKRLRG